MRTVREAAATALGRTLLHPDGPELGRLRLMPGVGSVADNQACPADACASISSPRLNFDID